MSIKKRQRKLRKKASVMFICTGNTCRSPMAQVIFKAFCRSKKELDVTVSSSGINVKSGSHMSFNAILALKKLGYVKSEKYSTYMDMSSFNCYNFVSMQFDYNFIHQFDMIVCMTSSHKNAIGDYNNVYLFSEISGGKDVFDPFGGSVDEYITVAKYFEYCCSDIYDVLLKLKTKNEMV
ncbi:MAG: hypothetical protein LBU60_06485 [Clostridiales bacterium]|jgi:protein-tyrosine phosphatase|nr:hypothetical protein [Clostridiales bacterium]